VTPPNEPGAPSEGGRNPDRGEGPPRQPATTRSLPSGPQREGPLTEVLRRAAPADAEARLNRLITGTAAPQPGDAYASELPDLSGPIPRAPERATPVERSEASAGPSGSGLSRPAAPEAREIREGSIQVGRRRRGPVRASMQIRRIDPWSTLKVSLLLSVALFFVWMIAVAFLYLVLGGMGVWAKLNSNVGDLLNNTSGGTAELVSAGTIFGAAFLVGLINIVLLTTLATIAAFVYNLATDVIGGIEVTLADRD